MKLFIRLSVALCLMTACGNNGSPLVNTGNFDPSVKQSEEPEQPLVGTVAGSVVCVTSGPNEQSRTRLEFTQSSSFDCPQVSPYNCTDCRFSIFQDFHNNSYSSLTYTCNGVKGLSVVNNAREETRIDQLGMTCIKN